MPAPRSVLIDIHERGLDPKVAHKSVDSAGRIKIEVGVTDQKIEAAEPQEKTVDNKAEAPQKAEANKKSPEVSDEKSEVAVSTEGVGSVESKQQEEVAVVTPPTSRRKRSSANNT